MPTAAGLGTPPRSKDTYSIICSIVQTGVEIGVEKLFGSQVCGWNCANPNRHNVSKSHRRVPLNIRDFMPVVSKENGGRPKILKTNDFCGKLRDSWIHLDIKQYMFS